MRVHDLADAGFDSALVLRDMNLLATVADGNKATVRDEVRWVACEEGAGAVAAEGKKRSIESFCKIPVIPHSTQQLPSSNDRRTRARTNEVEACDY